MFISTILNLLLFAFSYITLSSNLFLQKNPELNVINYHVSIEPDIETGSVKGSVIIDFLIDPNISKVVLNKGSLNINKVTGKDVINFIQDGNRIIINLADRDYYENQVEIFYDGKPSFGLVFDKELGQAYTVFSTSQWMVCNDSPGDRARVSMDILIPSDKDCIASGEFVQKTTEQNKTLFSWQQEYETPTYTYGFVIGEFNKYEEEYKDVSLFYYARDYLSDELHHILGKTKDMMAFFEEKSGVPYVQSSYSQILMGDHYQEMSGFSVLKNSYGHMVLKDSMETNLISHELAHQWWGNMITCKNWNHFWLNEGFATFMSAAYNQYRFGEEKYDSDISSYFEVYRKIKDEGNDKPLVFPDWINPTGADRNLVYFKGAYILHLLREEMGDWDFWKGIKFYSQKYFGKSVETIDFQHAMEESSGKNLETFFNKWFY